MSYRGKKKRGKTANTQTFLELRKLRLMMDTPGAWKIDFQDCVLWSGPVRVKTANGLYYASLHWDRERYSEFDSSTRPARRDPNEAVADAIKQVREMIVKHRILAEDAENSIVGGDDWMAIGLRDKAEDDAVKKEFDKIARLHAKSEETGKREDEFARKIDMYESRIEDLQVRVLDADGERSRLRERCRILASEVSDHVRIAKQAKKTARKAKNDLRKRLKADPPDEAEGEPPAKSKTGPKRRPLALR